MRLVTAGLIGLLTASSLSAQEPVRQEREHTVRDGDTLWDLAGFYFSNPFRWRVIYEANPMVVEDPHWIYPDEVLVIPGIAPDARDRDPEVELAVQDPPDRTVFYRPPPVTPRSQSDQATVLAEPALTSFPVRPGEFTSAPYLMNPGRLDVVAVFMRAIRDVYAGRGAVTSAHPQDRVFLSYRSRQRPQVGERFLIVHVGRRVDGARRADRIIYPRAVVRIVSLSPDVMEGQIERQYGPIHQEQLVVPIPMFPDFAVEEAEPVDGGYDLEAEILEFEQDDQPVYGPTRIAFINVGTRHGVKVGDVFEAYLPERAVRERRTGEFRAQIEQLPPEKVGDLRVIQVTDDYATVKVEQLRLMTMGPDLPVRRIRKVP